MKYLATLLLILGFGLSAFGQTIKSLGYNTTNGQVVYSGTNTLTFTNRFTQSSTNATNPPEVRLVTKSNAVASWFYYDAFGAGGANTTNDVDWSVLWLGNNHVASASGLDFGRADQSIGAISLTMENMYYAGSLPSPSHVGEFYINISDYTTNGSGTTRAMFVVGSQTNSTRGQVSFSYPIYLNYNQEAVDWLSTGSGLGGLNVGTTNSFQLATFYNTGTAHGGAARISIGAPANAMGIEAGPNYGYIRQFSAGRTAFRISTNGVIYGATNNSDTAQAPVHLAGNTRIDGAISFDNTTNAATTRANLGLGWSALTNTNAAKTLLGFDTNGQVVANTGTNVLTFTNSDVQFSTINSGYVGASWFFVTDGGDAIQFETETVAAATRTNLGLGWSALTNTNAATSLLGVTTNGQVVYSGTNFLKFVTSTNFSGNYWTAASFGLVSDASFAMNIVVADEGLSAGYEAPKGSIGSGGNVFSVKYGAPNEAWASPLLIDAPTQVHFGATWLTNTNVTNFKTALDLGSFRSPDGYAALYWGDTEYLNVEDGVNVYYPIYWSGTNGDANAAQTRTNLGLPLSALTNTSTANFRSAIGVAPAPIFKVLTNDFSITNQTNMTVVDGLTFTTEANKRYVVQLFPILSASASSMLLQIVASNATVYGFWDAQATLGLSTNVITNLFGSSVTAQRALLQTFHVVAGTNNGNIAFQFATITTPNTNTIHAGSYIMAQEVVPTP